MYDSCSLTCPWPLLKEEEGRREGIYTRIAVTCGATQRLHISPL
jgi:hypothetical protein